MSSKFLMYITFSFFIAAFICLIIEGLFFGDWFMGIVNSLTGYNVVQVSGAGIWAIPKLAWGFLIHGVPKLLSWDFSFFHGGWVFFRIFLVMTLSVGLVWGLIQTFLPVAQGILSRFIGFVGS